MKTTMDKKSGVITHTPESAVETAALDYLNNNRPLFAVAEPYILQAFIAGVQLGKADGLRDGIRQLIRDCAGAIGNLEDVARETEEALEELTEALKKETSIMKPTTKKGS